MSSNLWRARNWRIRIWLGGSRVSERSKSNACHLYRSWERQRNNTQRSYHDIDQCTTPGRRLRLEWMDPLWHQRAQLGTDLVLADQQCPGAKQSAVSRHAARVNSWTHLLPQHGPGHGTALPSTLRSATVNQHCTAVKKTLRVVTH